METIIKLRLFSGGRGQAGSDAEIPLSPPGYGVVAVCGRDCSSWQFKQTLFWFGEGENNVCVDVINILGLVKMWAGV